MSLSAKKKELTTLEREAANIVNEDEEEDVAVNNEEKYEAMINARKERRAVSLKVSLDELGILTF